MSTARAFLFDFSVIGVDAVIAKLVVAWLHYNRILVDVKADRTKKGFLDLLKQLKGDILVLLILFLFNILIEYSRFASHLIVVQG